MVDLYSGKTITTKADIWVIISRVIVTVQLEILGYCSLAKNDNYLQHRMILDSYVNVYI